MIQRHVVIGCAMCLAGSLAACRAEPGAVSDESWDAFFTRTQGWNGGDAAYSVDLGDGRTLWLFADSFVGPVAEGRRAAGNRFINNAIAVHPTPDRGQAAAQDSAVFLWGADPAGQPAAWVRPSDPGRWYWPADAVVAGERLILTLWRIRKSDREQGAFSFAHAGGAIGIVDDPRRPPREWTVRQFDNPHATEKTSSHGEIGWGGAIVKFDAPSNPPQTLLYIYGIKEAAWNKKLLLARVGAGQVERFDRWEFLAEGGRWSTELADAATLAEGLANEFRVHPVEHAGRTIWTLTHSQPMLGTRIMVRTARSPTGPWSAPRAVYDVPNVKNQPGHFTYAAKSHPHLARPGELLVSYVVNTGDIWQTLKDASVYRPRFIRVPLDLLPQPPVIAPAQEPSR
jgi:hypothetical protein